VARCRPATGRSRVPEFSTWTTDEDAGAFLIAQKEIELRERLMFGGRAIVAKATIADALDAYLNKAPKPHSTDGVRVEVMSPRRRGPPFGTRSVGHSAAAFSTPSPRAC